MPTHTCPNCGKEFEYKTIEESRWFPFCSRRCKLIDLGRWLDGKYVVPGSEEEDSNEEQEREE